MSQSTLCRLCKTNEATSATADGIPVCRECRRYNVCQKCKLAKDSVEEQYSFGVYAGTMCHECAYKGFRDHCGLGPEGRQGTPQEYEELGGGDYWSEDDRH